MTNYIMKSKINSMTDDVLIYSKGLRLAIKQEKLSEAKNYVKKIKKQLILVDKYLKVKNQLNKAEQYGIKNSD